MPECFLKQRDVFVALPELESDLFDLCIADPPYGVSTTKK